MEKSIAVHRGSVRILRIFISGIFLVAGFNHIINTNKVIAHLERANFKGFAYFFGEPKTLIVLSGIVMLSAGLAFLIGIYTRNSAIILALVLLPITLAVQVGQIETLGPLFKNIAIMGGLLFFIINKNQNILTIKS